MIKNVIFDFGKVMVHFEPKYMVEQYVRDPDDSALLQEVIFDRRLWDRLDDGTISDAEVLAACREQLPKRLHADAERIYYNWIYHIPEIEGMRELVREIKETFGVRVFLLSNISTYFAAHKDEIPCLAEFEGCVFSAVCGKIKPHADIFAHLCDTYGIAKEESIFIDDNENNIRGAEAFGIQGYLFDGDVAKLRRFLTAILKKECPRSATKKPSVILDTLLGGMKILLPLVILALLALVMYFLVRIFLANLASPPAPGDGSGIGFILFFSHLFLIIADAVLTPLGGIGLLISYCYRSTPKRKKNIKTFWWITAAPILSHLLYALVSWIMLDVIL